MTAGRPPELGHVAGAEARLLARIEGLTDAEAWAPSQLPDWSRAEVLTHLARNADAFRGLTESAMRDEVGDQYPGGSEQRDSAIAEGRGRPAAEVVRDLAQSIEWLHETWAAMPDEAWTRLGRLNRGGTAAIAATVLRRWVEVEFHHVDLGLGGAVEDWPRAFVESCLPIPMGRLAEWAVEPPDARWVLWADDVALAWSVSSLAGQVTVGRFDEDDPPPDVIIRGPGARLLWFVYRGEAVDLTVSGEGQLLRRFTEHFRAP